MRFLHRFLILALCFILLAMPAAASQADTYNVSASIASDGSCFISVNLTVFADGEMGEFLYPLPAGAYDVSVNGSSASLVNQGGISHISLTRYFSNMRGSISVSISYRIKEAISAATTGVTAKIPLLTGFSLPVQTLSFTVSFPDDLPETSVSHISFSSTYMQEAVGTILSYSVDGRTLTGSVNQTLNDHDSLYLSLPLPIEFFPGAKFLSNVAPWPYRAMAVCCILGLIYWMLFLRFLPPLPRRQSVAPGSITAGEIGSILSDQPVSLPLIAISWAQMGYLHIEQNRKGHVLLRKKMDMGNERSAEENRIFQALFRRSPVADTASASFARLSSAVGRSRKMRTRYIHPGFHDTRIFSYFFAGAGFFAGIAIASAWFISGFTMIFWCVALSLFGAISALLIQQGIACLFLHATDKKLWAAICAALWILLGVLSKQIILCFCVLLIFTVAGFIGPYSRRRTPTGRQLLGEIYGLRRYICTLHRKDRVAPDNPDYFYQLLPYALAFGAEDALAEAYENKMLPECTFLSAPRSATKTPALFAAYVHSLIFRMDDRRKNLIFERFLPR